MILENYGYQVIDLGRDVPPERWWRPAMAEDVSLVGLSRPDDHHRPQHGQYHPGPPRQRHPCKTLVGGAVLTPEYAAEIGADYYAKDAKQSADIAREVLR